MKTVLLFLSLLVSYFNQSLAQRMTVVNRWISPVVNDFMSYPEAMYTDEQLISWGYTQKTYQFETFFEHPGEDNITRVSRWIMPNCKESILIAEHEHTDAQMESWGYHDKLFQFFAYKSRPTDGRKYKPVYRWINAKPQGDPCRDFTLTTYAFEFNDNTLRSWGYTEKRLQFYIPVF